MRQARHRLSAWLGLLACVLLACVSLGIGGCRRTPAEQAIREQIAAMQTAADKHDIDAVIAPLADDFIGNSDEGEPLDRKNFQRYLTLMQLRQGGSIHATLGPITVVLAGKDRATATFIAVVTGGAGLLPDDGRIEQVSTGWRLDGRDWKLISVEWKATVSDK